jgi:hypothetical protein
MELLVGFFIFCLVLFLYLHCCFHLKTSDDLEVYEIDQASKDKMEEICDLRQPVLFDLDNDNDKILKSSSKSYILQNYPVFEVKIRNTKQTSDDTELYTPLQLKHAAKLCDEDKTSSFFSENNSEFLLETGVLKNFQYNDEFLRPRLVSNCYYDIMFGSLNTTTPFRYELNYRNYFMVTQGELQIKLSPPKSAKYLYETKDYENMEFISPVNPWTTQPKYQADFDKIKCLEITLRPGKCLYIPAYWWYSFKFNKDTSVSCFKYKTYMNNVAVLPHYFMYFLQNQNVDRRIAKTTNTINTMDNRTDVISDDTKSTTDIPPITNDTVVSNDSTVIELNDNSTSQNI